MDFQNRSIHTLSNARPFPSMEILMPRRSRYCVHRALVYCVPWSELTISGLPCSAIASSSMLLHQRALRELLIDHPTILRLYTSMMAVKYINPFFIGIYVMSVHHTWLGRSMVKPFSK